MSLSLKNFRTTIHRRYRWSKGSQSGKATVNEDDVDAVRIPTSLRQQERLMPTLAGMLFCILILRKPNRNIPPYRRHDSAALPASVPAFRFDINSWRPFSFSASLARGFKALINFIPSCTQKSRVIDQSLPVAWRGRDDTVLQRQINLQPAVAPLVTSICHEP